MNPTRFGKYQLLSKLGAGGMAEVFQAHLVADPNVMIAVKRILPEYSQDKKLISMLVNEARLTVGLAHPNIVPVLDFGLIDNQYFIAMEYIRGRDLKSVMIRCKMRGIPLPIQIATFITIQVLRGLQHAHTKRDSYDQPLKIVHRDISPHNVMISLWGQVKILDFGIAKAASRSGETQAGTLKGKFSYMSPEQARAEDVDARTDIFSAGIVLWELLTLESCYHADTDIQLLKVVRNANVRNPADVNPKIPDELADVVMKALHKRPRKRFQTAVDFCETLEAFQAERFGTVNEADLAAYIRSLFGLTAKDIETTAPPRSLPANLLSEGIDHALDDVYSGSRARPGRRKRSFLEKGLGFAQDHTSTVVVAGLIALVALFFVNYSPLIVFRALDRQVLRLAAELHSRGGPEPSLLLRYRPLEWPEPGYALTILPGAKNDLEDLPFEAFDRVRGQLTDLGFEPRPSFAHSDPDRPGLRVIEESGYRIRYRVNDSPRSVIVESIERYR